MQTSRNLTAFQRAALAWRVWREPELVREDCPCSQPRPALRPRRPKPKAQAPRRPSNLEKLEAADYPFEPGEREECNQWNSDYVDESIAAVRQMMEDDQWLKNTERLDAVGYPYADGERDRAGKYGEAEIDRMIDDYQAWQSGREFCHV